MQATLKKIYPQYHALLFISSWVIITISYFFFFGVNTNLEGEKYIDQANYFLFNHSFTEGRFIFYSTTIFIIAFSQFITTSVLPAFFILAAFNFFAYFSLYKIMVTFWNSKLQSLLFCVLLMLYFPFQSWITYLYTENIFYSLVILLIARLIIANYNFSLVNIAYCSFIILLLVFSRPLGMFFFVPFILFLFFKFNKWQKVILSIVLLLGMIVLAYVSKVILTTTPDWTVQRSFIEENLICDVPTNFDSNTKLNLIITGNPITELLYYATHNITHFLTLASKRLLLFFGNIRSYYSLFHNLFLIFSLTPIYIVSILKFRQISKYLGLPISIFVISTSLIFAIVVSLQCDDYHNRFFMALFPFWLLFFYVGIKDYFFLKTQ